MKPFRSDARRYRHLVRRTMLPVDSVYQKFDIEDLGEDEELIVYKFFQHFCCYDVIPISAKLVVFDTQLPLCFCLGVRAAPLWDSSRQEFVGMLTITDFIHILRTYYKSPQINMEELEDHKLETWLNVLKTKLKPLYTIKPEASLYEAIKTLIQGKVHRLPEVQHIFNF
ncbi:5'-AMP-activated protein kinase subunit gamma-1-like isoform X2 [Tachypleus tridentatus]|uniref:5'-AMP-activated protein kinase subunit gamma-1-like isoform X2 n=1 Tax=Tachypleus tridentatus TaxID=6853 RepID=UPI003FD254D5